jgi:VIT1/CCC1 family predicted Fe2+/Mn2+ transporter
MTEQLALNIVSASVGLVAAIFFCVGNAFNTAKLIAEQTTPSRGRTFLEPLASSLAAQRAQYIVGAVLLLITFILQIAGALASSSTDVSLPSCLKSWPMLVVAVIIPTVFLGATVSWLIQRHTMQAVRLLVPQVP